MIVQCSDGLFYENPVWVDEAYGRLDWELEPVLYLRGNTKNVRDIPGAIVKASKKVSGVFLGGVWIKGFAYDVKISSPPRVPDSYNTKLQGPIPDAAHWWIEPSLQDIWLAWRCGQKNYIFDFLGQPKNFGCALRRSVLTLEDPFKVQIWRTISYGKF